MRTLVTLCAVGALLTPTLARAQTSDRRALTAVRLQPGDRLVVDGSLDDEPWNRAMAASGFMQQDPDTGEPATEQTDVRVLYDDHRIVIGVRALDSQPDHLFANQMQRDQALDSDDRFMVAIDTYSDGRSGYYFEINPAGAMGDGLVLPGTGINVNRSWDGIWLARVARDQAGWTAEIEIPLRTINFDPGASSWGINFQRTIKRKQEETLWSGWARNQGLTLMSSAGRLDGLMGLSQGIGLDLIPYAIASDSAAPGRGAPSSIGSATGGGDIAYNLTPGLRANLSLNTDFAEADVDQRQVNLTRFPLFFPEKRAFFLEGASVFNFGREPGNAVIPFFSRRIGLDSAGVPQPIDVGAKLTGHAGAYDIGVLDVRTRDHTGVPGENFAVARTTRRFWQQSYVGAIATTRSDAAAAARQTEGVDFAFATSSFLRRQQLEVSGFYLNTTKTPGTRGGASFGARLNLPNDPFLANISVREVQDGYDPAVGFVDRRAYRLIAPNARYQIHTNRNPHIRRFSFEFNGGIYYDLNGVLESRDLNFQIFRMVMQSNDSIEFHLLPTYERLPRDFQISPGVILPAGSAYSFLRRQFQMSSTPRRPVAGSLTYEDGAFYSGTRRRIAPTISVRPHPGWLINVGGDFNNIALQQGRFTTRVFTNDVNTQFNPFVSLTNRIQYDTVTRQLGWQSRFRWIMRPGNDLFLVYTQNWIDYAAIGSTNVLQTLDRKGSLKVVRTLRF